MIMNLDIKFQIVELLVMILTLGDYFKKKKIPLITTYWFMVMLYSGVLYLILDIASVYTSTRMTYSPVNDIIHKFYYILIVFCVGSYATYIELFGIMKRQSRKINPLWTVAFPIPFVVSVVGIVVGKVRYTVSVRGAYSYGLSTNFMIFGISFYFLYAFVKSFIARKEISRSNAIAIHRQMLLWIFVFVMRFVNPNLSLMGLALTIGYIMLYYSFENHTLFIDESTDVYNRNGFSHMMTESYDAIRGGNYFLAALVIDDMDLIISSIGRERFELLMQQVAKRISYDSKLYIYRIFDNVFVTKISMKADKMKSYADYVEKKMGETFELVDTNIDLSSHMLVVECPKFLNNANDMIELLRYDIHDSKDYVRIVSENVVDRKAREEALLVLLKNAIENDGFDVAYQPIYSIHEKAFISAEALVRLKDCGEMGFVSPEEFIPIAEKNGYIIKLGECVFEKTCDTILQIRESNARVDYIEINVSTLQIIDENVLRSFLGILNKKGLPAESVNLEITETAAAQSKRLMERNMNALKAAGCSFSMDDFGTGFSNLSGMTNSNFDIVKLDKSLIWPCFSDREESIKARVLLRNTIVMLKELGFSIVAEGVETKEMVDLLTKYGVDYLQGYYYSKPVSKEAYMNFVKVNQ